jgi:hypothetical protein
VTHKLSSRGKYVSVNIGPVTVVSSDQVFSLSLSLIILQNHLDGYSIFIYCVFYFDCNVMF